MKVRRASAFCAMGMVLSGVGALAPSADAHGAEDVHGAPATWAPATVDPARTCYAQSDRSAPNYIISQNWEPSFDAYDSQAADDFVLTKPCRRPLIDIDGTYGEGTGTADSFNVTIYRAKKNGPGKVVRYLGAVEYVDTCHDLGCAQIRLGKQLLAGHWWISVQANLSWSETGSEWGVWTNVALRNSKAKWRNPPDGFATGCTTYTNLVTCLGKDTEIGDDLSFSISSG